MSLCSGSDATLSHQKACPTIERGDRDVDSTDIVDMALTDKDASPVLHVAVVCFDHSYGNRLEYIYPPLPVANDAPQTNDGPNLPATWSNLPFMALPDGAHQRDEDYVYFTLPCKLM